MKVTMIALVATAILAAPGAYAQAQSTASGSSSKSYYYWLHPKLGMVKVDKKTNFMLVGRRAQQASVTQ